MQGARIGMVATRCQPEIGGIESHVAAVAGRLAERGYDLEVLTTDRSGRLPSIERRDGYVVRRFRAWPAHRDWYFSPGLVMALLRSRYDVVHVQGVHTLVPPLAMLTAIVRRIPFLLTFHTGGNSSAFRERARSTQFRLLAPLLRRARRLVGVSEFEKRRFDAVLGEETVAMIRNGGSLPVLHEVVDVQPGLVVTAGRLERYKGHHRLIEALPDLVRTCPDAAVEILGSGPYEAELRALAERLGVADRVSIRFVPPEDRAEMARSLGRAEVVTLLSDYEAHPVAVMEALTAGRPVVVSRTSGLTEMADMGWAVGVDAEAAPSAVAAAVLAQMRSPLLPSPSVLPTWETCVSALSDTYDSIIMEAGRRAVTGAA